jgi:hypothetical protein
MGESDAWKLRYRTPHVVSTQLAAERTTLGLVAHNRSGAVQY